MTPIPAVKIANAIYKYHEKMEVQLHISHFITFTKEPGFNNIVAAQAEENVLNVLS